MTSQPPEILKTVSERSGALADTRAELQELVTAVDDYQTRVGNLSATEREHFYESVSHLRDHVATASDPSDLLDIRDDLEEAVRSPLQQAAQDSLVALLGQLQPDLSDAECTQTFDALKSKIPVELEGAIAAYQHLTDRVVEFDAVIIEMLAAAIEAEPSILQRPQEELVPLADQFAARNETLEEIETVFATSDWAPAIDLASDTGFYRDDPSHIDHSVLQTRLESVNDGLRTLDRYGIDLQSVLQENIRDAVDVGDLAELADTLEESAETVPTAADDYVTATEFVTTLEATDSLPETFEDDVEALRESHSTLQNHNYTTVEYLVQRLDELTEEIDAFVDSLHGRLQAQHDFIQELEEAGDRASRPELCLQMPPSSTAVRADPESALADYAALSAWLDSCLDDDDDAINQARVLELWQSLAENRAIEITEENQETVLALSERLSLQVILND